MPQSAKPSATMQCTQLSGFRLSKPGQTARLTWKAYHPSYTFPFASVYLMRGTCASGSVAGKSVSLMLGAHARVFQASAASSAVSYWFAVQATTLQPIHSHSTK